MLSNTSTQLRFGLAAAAIFGLLVLFSSTAQRTLGNGFLPHGYCFTWIPGLLWLHVVSDVLIALAYLSIPLTLLHFVRRRQDLPFSWVFVLFGVFIVACGTTHALDVWTIWNPDYWLSGSVKALTAAASVPTAAALVWLLPKALAIPSAAQLRAANDALRQEIDHRKRVESSLEESRAELSRRVAERSRDLQQTNALLDSFFESSPLGLAVFDSQLRYVRVNGTLAALNGLAVESHWGRTVAEVDEKADPRVFDALKTIRDRKAKVVQFVVGAPADAQQWRMTFHIVPRTGSEPLIGHLRETIAGPRPSPALSTAEIAARAVG